jgi:hypothetical protein
MNQEISEISGHSIPPSANISHSVPSSNGSGQTTRPDRRLLTETLARFAICGSIGGQSQIKDHPGDCRAYLMSLVFGQEEIEDKLITAKVAAKRFGLRLEAPDYIESRHFNANRTKKDVELTGKDWIFKPREGEGFLEGSHPDVEDYQILADLVAKPGIGQPRPPVVTGFVPRPQENLVVTWSPKDRDSTDAIDRIIQVLIKKEADNSLKGLTVGEATWVWYQAEEASEPDPDA